MATYKTPKEALEACLEIWECIVNNPDIMDKEEAYKELGIPVDRDLYHCPACEYTREGGRRNCDNCPIWAEDVTGYGIPCERGHSPYYAWVYPSGAWTKDEAAAGMVELIRLRLKELTIKGHEDGYR